MKVAKYTIEVVSNDFVLIADLDEGVSITNSAENVIRKLSSELIGGIGDRIVFYKDTYGRYDLMNVSNEEFTSFSPCSEEQNIILKNLSAPLSVVDSAVFKQQQW